MFLSGSIGINPETKKLVEGGIVEQTRQVLENLKNVVEASGSNLSKVVKTTILLTDIGHFGAVNEIYAEYFPTDPPARATYAVVALPAGALVEIEATALA